METCDSCGIQKLQFYPTELSTDLLIKWRRVSYVVVGKNRSEGEKKVPQLQYMETPPRVLIEYLKPKLVKYVLHNFISKRQEKEFKRTLSRLQPDTILSCIDFSQNYSMKVQDEVQSMHWHSQQITILVHITYMWNPEYDEQVPESRILKESHYYVSDEKEHDSLYVQHAFNLHWEFLKQKSLYLKCHVVWSDGCSAQFKAAKC
jgi:hypothetical protein